MKLTNFYIRDPFILPVPEHGGYYLYGTNYHFDNDVGFDTYFSRDLREWEGPFEAFRPPKNFWAKKQFWAPEVTRVGSKFVMLATFTGSIRGTQVLTASDPRGPFTLCGDGPITPRERWSLDGTLHIDSQGDPWMVYADDWHFHKCNGTIRKVRLGADFLPEDEESSIILSGNEAEWNAELLYVGPGTYCAEGPFVWRGKSGDLFLTWSGFTREKNYTIGVARSLSGSIVGPWHKFQIPLWSGDGGHCMIFRSLENQPILALHSPGYDPISNPERAVLFPIEEISGTLVCHDTKSL